ncbi:MAG TPA: sensor domain-containing diguanylate cyclase [Actinomycetota bacterium]
MLVLLALAASGESADLRVIGTVLVGQMILALAGHAVSVVRPRSTGLMIWVGMMTDVAAIATMMAAAGGPRGPLPFILIIQALGAGILLSSRAGLRFVVLSTVAVLLIDLTAAPASQQGGRLPTGLITIATLWIVGGAGALFSTMNERDLRSRHAELSTIRRIALDIEDSLTIEEIFSDLCAGVVEGFRFDGAAILLVEGQSLRCVAAQGLTGARDMRIELRGRVERALTSPAPTVTATPDARADATLVPLVGPRGYIAIPLSHDGLLIVTRSGRKGRPGVVRSNEIDALEGLSHHARLAIANARLHAHVRAMAITDPLTGLANHGEMQRRLSAEVGRLTRYSSLKGKGHRLSLVLLDIDEFKALNDRFGHLAGDAVLKGVAAAIRSAVRSFDVAARYGGEEFAVILPETGSEGAMTVAERIRSAVAAYPYAPRDGEHPVRVTVSAGVATADQSRTTPDELIEAADAALYESKASGRDRVTLAGPGTVAVGEIVRMDATRRRQGSAASRARGGSRPARARSSRPKRRTPRA